jgi:hypothetical protein
MQKCPPPLCAKRSPSRGRGQALVPVVGHQGKPLVADDATTAVKG